MSKTMNSLNHNKEENGETVKAKNKYLANLKEDVLYHLALGSGTHNLQKMFGDVKFVCMGGTVRRMKTFADFIMTEIGYELPTGADLIDITAKAHRFSMYKVGPVLAVNHGMGMPSLSILLHELIKLMHYAQCKDPIFLRLGSSGGVNVKPGTVVVTEEPVNSLLKPGKHEFVILGKRIERPAILDKHVASEIVKCSQPGDNFDTVLGKTMSTDDFYEGQGRVDGAICEHTEDEKFEFLKKLKNLGVKNIEMEATLFAALTHYTGIKAAIICVTFLDRMNGDQVTEAKEVLVSYEERPQIIAGRYIKKTLKELGLLPKMQ